MADDIKITANIHATRPNACRFTVDRPVFEDGSAFFWDKEKLKGSPLAKRLFALEGVKSVRIEGHDVTVTRATSEDWRPFAGLVGEAIRAQLKSGEACVVSGFKPDMKADFEIKNKVQMIFDTEINPAVASHGGHIELIDVKEGKIYLKMSGGCQGCGSAEATLRQGIETTLRDRLPEIEEILDVTEHGAGTNPYYQASKK